LSDNIPVIIQFHGGSGTSKEAYYREGNLNGVADSEGILMIFPQADISTGSVWNTLHSDEGNKVSADDFGFIEAIIDFLEEDNRIDTSRIYVAGYSNGAAMAYQIACHLNDRVAGFVVHSGNFPLEEVISNEYPCDITGETPGLIFNGTADMTRPLEGIPTYAVSVRDGAQWWADQNNSVSKTTSQDGNIERTIYVSEAGTEVQLFIIEDGGHDWFNFTIDGMPLDAFTWDFFSTSSS
jgi:polyhydroxybutyrate depolymerase